MRILIAGQTYAPALNGQAVFTVNLAEGLAQRGHDLWVLVPAVPGRADGRAHAGVQIREVPSVALNFLHQDLFFTPFPGPSARQVLDAFKPDVVHIHDHYPICRAVLNAARKRGPKTVATNHFMPENLLPYFPRLTRRGSLLNRALWIWALSVLNRVDIATAPSRTAASILRENGLRVPVHPISCGVDPRRFFPDPSIDRQVWRRRYGLDMKKTVFLFVGRVDGEKRLDTLLHALSQMDRDDVQVAIAGQGAALPHLQALAARLGLGERVRFLGFVPNEDLPALLNSIDVFVMPSDAELLSIATLEAMACGRPILAANARALPELVSPGLNGYLFQPGDAEDAAQHMALLADQPAKWAEMGAASARRAEAHHLEKAIFSYEALYESLLAGSPFAIHQPEEANAPSSQQPPRVET